MPRYDVQFTVTGYVEAETRSHVEDLLENHLVLYLSEPGSEGNKRLEADYDLNPFGLMDLEIKEQKG